MYRSAVYDLDVAGSMSRLEDLGKVLLSEVFPGNRVVRVIVYKMLPRQPLRFLLADDSLPFPSMTELSPGNGMRGLSQ
jgi:hypothetical protein